MKVFQIENFGVGYDDSVTPEMAKENTTQDTEMVDYAIEIGALQKDTGERNIGAKVSVSTDFYPLAGSVQRIYEGRVDVSGSGDFENKRLAIAAGKPYHFCAGDQFIPLASTALFSSITAEIPDITHMQTKFFIAGGYETDCREWDGTKLSISTNIGLGSWSITASIYLCRGKVTEFWNNRLWIGNTIESEDNGTTWEVHESRLRWSAQGYPNLWNNTNEWDVAITVPWSSASAAAVVFTYDPSSNDLDGNDEIVRLMVYGDEMLVFKRDSLHKVVYTGGAPLLFDMPCIDRSTINNAPWTVAAIPAGVIFLNEEGLQITDGNTVQQYQADMKVTKLLKRLRKDSIARCFGLSHESLHEYWLSVPLDGAEYCNYLIVYNWKFDTWKIRKTNTSAIGLYTTQGSGTWSAIDDYYGYELIDMTWGDGKLYGGSKRGIMGRDDGYMRERSLAYNMVGSAYNSYHVTGFLDFETPGINKEVVALQPLWEGSKGDYVTVSCKSDSDSTWTTTTSDAFDSSGVSEQPLLFLRKLGRKFKFRIENNNANEYYRVYKMKVYYEQRALR